MPALHIEDLPEKEKLKMEVEQLRKEVKLQRQQASWMPQDISFCETNQDRCCLVCCSKTNSFLALGWVELFLFLLFLQLLLKGALVVLGNCLLMWGDHSRLRREQGSHE